MSINSESHTTAFVPPRYMLYPSEIYMWPHTQCAKKSIKKKTRNLSNQPCSVLHGELSLFDMIEHYQ